MKKIIPLSAVLFLVSVICYGQGPGDLDSTFGINGKVFTKVYTSQFHGMHSEFNRASSVTIDSNRIYLIGTSYNDVRGDMDITVAAYSFDGKPDNSFSDDGKQSIPLIGRQGGTDIIAQPDGKLLLCGDTWEELIVSRINYDGTIDASWGDSGVAIFNTAGTEMTTRIAIQSDGKVIAAGWNDNHVNDLVMIRFTKDGNIDTSFAESGIFTMDFGVNSDRIEGLAIQNDDKIIVSGSVNVNGFSGIVMRLTSNGKLDYTFNSTGYNLIDKEVTSSRLQPDNKIIVACQEGVLRLNTDGTIDNTFGNNGFANSPYHLYCSDIRYHSTGNIVICGYTYSSFSPSTGRDFAIVVFDTVGNLSCSFGSFGISNIDMGSATDDYGSRGDVLPNGNLIITGQWGLDESFGMCSLIGPSSQTIKYYVTACNSYTSPRGKIWTVSDIYKDTIPGCYSIITIDLTIKKSSTSSIIVTSNDSYISPGGKIWTVSDTYMDTIPNAAGCDSIITIDLTIKKSTASTISVKGCDSYTSPSGKVWTVSDTYMDTIPNAAGRDSIITIDLTINKSTASTITVKGCDSYTSPSGKLWTVSDTYMDTIPNAAGCDSIISIYLTIDCTNSISRNIILPVSIYPNPFNDFVTIELDEICDNLTLEVYDLKGQLIAKSSYKNIKQLTYNIKGAPGSLVLKLSDNKGKMHVVELIKQ